MKNRKKLEATAYHEAGHAVAAYFLRRPFRFVTIKPGGDSLGRFVGRKEDYRRRFKMVEKGYIDTSDAVISAAGPEAEKKYRGRYNHRGADRDYMLILDVARGVGEDGYGGMEDSPMAQAIAGAAFKEANLLVNVRWFLIERVVRELLLRETLSFDEVHSLVMEEMEARQRKEGAK